MVDRKRGEYELLMHEMVWPKEPLGSLAIKATFGQNQTVLGEYGESTSDGRFSPAGRATQVAMWVQAQDQDCISVDKGFAAHPGQWGVVARERAEHACVQIKETNAVPCKPPEGRSS